jgi:hypothetical protein
MQEEKQAWEELYERRSIKRTDELLAIQPSVVQEAGQSCTQREIVKVNATDTHHQTEAFSDT